MIEYQPAQQQLVEDRLSDMYSPASSHEPAKAVSSKAKPSQAKVIA
jgi:hypothetical protein